MDGALLPSLRDLAEMTMNLNCISEWDRRLPLPDELTPLSQALIPHELACAFNISTSSSMSIKAPPSSDVQNASRSAFESLLHMRSILLPSVEFEQKDKVEPSYQGNVKEEGMSRGNVNTEKGEIKMTLSSYQGDVKEERVSRGNVKPVKETPNRSLDGMQIIEAGRVGSVLMARAFSSSAPSSGHDYGSALGPNGLSRLNTSYVRIPENSVTDVGYPKALIADRRDGCGHTGGAMDVQYPKSLLEEGRDGCGRTGGSMDVRHPKAFLEEGRDGYGGRDGSMQEAANLIQLKVDPCKEDEPAPSMDTFPSNSMAISNEEQSARTLKKPRLVWTPQLHKRFVDAVAHLGIKHAVPKTIMELMNVDGLTRENVASHLQKYRLYLKRMQGLSNEGPSSSDHLFASTPVPPSLAASAHFLAPHHSQHLDHPFGPVQNATLPTVLGHTTHHLAPHISSPMPSFSSFNVRPTFSTTLVRAPPPPPKLNSEVMREHQVQHSSFAASQVLTLFPTGGS